MIDFKSELDEILKEYKGYLEEKNHRKEYIQEHLNFLRFFGINYLNNYGGVSLAEIDSVEIEGFLGDWCIRKVLDFKKGDIIPYLRIFKKFNAYLFHTGKISEEEYYEIKDVCNSPRVFVKKFEGYLDLDPEAEDWNKRYENWLFGNFSEPAESLKDNIESILDFDTNLIENLPENAEEQYPITKDYKTFLNYISHFKGGIKLTNNTFCLKRKDIIELNSKMIHPEALDKYVMQTDTVLIHFFFLVSKKLGLTQYTKKMKLRITSLWDEVVKLPSKHLMWVLFRGLWDTINWYRLNGYSQSGRPEWSFDYRYTYSKFFSALDVNIWFPFQNLKVLYNQFINRRTNFHLQGGYHLLLLIGVFPNKILPLLDYFRFLELNHRGEKRFENSKLKITELGKYVFSNLKKMV